jgi:hypothetical protein
MIIKDGAPPVMDFPFFDGIVTGPVVVGNLDTFFSLDIDLFIKKLFTEILFTKVEDIETNIWRHVGNPRILNIRVEIEPDFIINPESGAATKLYNKIEDAFEDVSGTY